LSHGRQGVLLGFFMVIYDDGYYTFF
jgi:hypothetical protein